MRPPEGDEGKNVLDCNGFGANSRLSLVVRDAVQNAGVQVDFHKIFSTR
jgi:hypothetical protein